MPLEHDPTPRFTPDQRDAILDLAARLQTHHETTVGIDELMRAAQETGLEPRFVQEAAMRLSQQPETQTIPRSFFLVLGLFVIQAACFLNNELTWQARGSVGLEWPDLLGAACVALPIAFLAARSRACRRFLLLVPSVAWIAICLPYGGLSRIVLGYVPNWLPGESLLYAGAQSLAVLVALLMIHAFEWRPEGARSFRLHRGS